MAIYVVLLYLPEGTEVQPESTLYVRDAAASLTVTVKVATAVVAL